MKLSAYFKLSTSAYYRYISEQPKPKFDYELVNAILDFHKYRKIIGYRQMHLQLKRRYGIYRNPKTVLKYMRYLGINGMKVKNRIKTYGLERSKVYDNMVNQEFYAEKPNQKWSIDITYLITNKNRRFYLVCIKDLFDKRIVSYEVSNTCTFTFVRNALIRAFNENNVNEPNLVLHSDQGIHFSCNLYNDILKEFKVKGSHSRKGNSIDNAIIETHFSVLKREQNHYTKAEDYNEMKEIIDDWIHYYNYERYQEGLNEKTPMEYNSLHQC